MLVNIHISYNCVLSCSQGNQYFVPRDDHLPVLKLLVEHDADVFHKALVSHLSSGAKVLDTLKGSTIGSLKLVKGRDWTLCTFSESLVECCIKLWAPFAPLWRQEVWGGWCSVPSLQSSLPVIRYFVDKWPEFESCSELWCGVHALIHGCFVRHGACHCYLQHDRV